MRGLLLGDDDRVASWAFKYHNLVPTPYNLCIGIVEPDGRLVGAILFQNYNGNNVEISYYGRRTITSGIVTNVARAALTFDPSRVTITTSKKNKRLIRGLKKIGFDIEGLQKRFYGKQDCPKNTGVRLVIFREGIEKLARFNAL